MTVVPLSPVAAIDLVDLAWELTCTAGVVVKIDSVHTDVGEERCVSARCVAGEHAFMLVPRSLECIEVWWGEYDAPPRWVGAAVDVESVLALARHTVQDRAA